MAKKILLLSVFFLTTFSCLFAQSEMPSWAFRLSPGVVLPIGDSSNLYKTGFGAAIAGERTLKKKPSLFLSGNLAYHRPPVQADTALGILSFGGGSGLNHALSQKLLFKGFVNGGGYYGYLTDKPEEGASSAFNPYLTVGTGLYYSVTRNLDIGAEASYRNFIGLYNGIGLSLGTVYQFKPREKVERKPKKQELAPRPEPLEEEPAGDKGTQLEVFSVEFEEVFPVFFKYYDEHAVGRVVIKNWENTPITDISVSLFVKQYMDSPKECGCLDRLEGGAESAVDLYALFTEKVLEITEGTKSAADIILDYTHAGERYTGTKVETLSFYDRNATMWDDDRKAAAFVTAKDPVVLKFSKNLAGIIKGKGSRAVSQNLRMAMAVHEALSLYGMSYVVDPTTPYETFSQQKLTVDYLQFPRQTLDYRAGDCDDLSILYGAMLESVGIETAFITTPGHIFIAFSVDMDPGQARKAFLRADELIFREDDTWIPVEVTSIHDGFLKAWEQGAKQWREAAAREKAGFFATHLSWQVYGPVGLPTGSETIELPSRDKVTVAYLEQVIRFIDREIYPQVAKLQAEIKESDESPKSVNRLGVLYARYGLMDRAEREFDRILKKESDYVPALINLGNISYLQNDMKKSLAFYERAFMSEPDNPKVLLSLARANHELENYGSVREAYEKLKSIEPDLAVRFAYLDLRGDEAERASAIADVREVVVWAE